MKKILLIGSEGQLGSDIVKTARNKEDVSLVGINFPETDVTNKELLESNISEHNPDVIISTAAFHDVDLCEEKTQNAYAVNTIGVLNLARLSKKFGSKLVTFSTDYVFGDPEDKTPFTETSTPSPQSVYAASKLAGETLAMIYHPDSIIIRTCGLYGETAPLGKAYNFPQIMLKLARDNKKIEVIDDQICTPTWTRPLAEVVVKLIDSNINGIVHATCQGGCSWYEFATEIFNICNIKPNLSPVSTKAYGQAAKRPAYSVLENSKLKKAGLDSLPHWKTGLKKYLELVEK